MLFSNIQSLFRVLRGSNTRRRSRREDRGFRSVWALEDRRLLAGDTDDQISEAFGLGEVSLVRPTTGYSIEAVRDVDLFSFKVSAGQRVSFDIDRPSGSLDSVIRLFNSTGVQTHYNDDGRGAGESSTSESFLDVTFVAAGTYYLGVSGYGNSTYNALTGNGDANGTTGVFNLVVTPVTPFTTTVNDTDDQISEAQNLGALPAIRSLTGKTIELATDVDMFTFTVNAGQRVTFDIDRPSGNLDSVIRLFNASGTQLQSNDDGIAPGEALTDESYLDVTFAVAGTYALGVSGFGNANYNAVTGAGDTNGRTGAFTLVVTPFPSKASDADDQLSEALKLGTVSAPFSVTGNTIDVAADVDMFSFQVTAGQRMTFDLDRPSGELDSIIRLFDSTGTQFKINDDGRGEGESSTRESFLDVTFGAAGTYYLGVSGYGNSTYNAVTGAGDKDGKTGAYNVVVTLFDAKTLYVNFDGASLTNAQLRVWASTDWAAGVSGYLDTEGDGIRVTRFLNGRADRDAVIAGIILNLQADLAPYGIKVQRTTSLAISGVGATTLFFGSNNIDFGSHIACDIDYSNNNKTDIAFITDEVWETTSRTITALSDVALHEAGHTFGLFHVNTTVNGTIYPESMGLRYSTPSTEWIRDTSFMDRTFTEYLDHGDGRGTQNTHQTMLANFSVTANLTMSAEPQLSASELRAIFAMDIALHTDHDHDHDHDHDESGLELADAVLPTPHTGFPTWGTGNDAAWFVISSNRRDDLWV